MSNFVLNSRLVTTILALFFSLLITTSSALAAVGTTDLIYLQILTINDFHGALIESGKNPGAAKVAQYLQNMKMKNPNGTLLLSAGDMFQGSPDSNLLYGKTVVDVMNSTGFDAMTLGNHEFDWGIPILKSRIDQSNFPYVAANIIENSTGQSPDFIKPYVFFQRNGINIAVIGMSTPETAYKSSPKITSFYTFTDPAKVVNLLVPELKRKGADLIIVLSHMASFMNNTTGEITDEAADLAMNTHGIDGIVSAHSHQLVHGTVNHVPIVQAGYNGRAVGTINILFKKSTQEVLLSSATVTQLPINGLTPDSTIQGIITRAQKEIAPVKNLILGKTINELSHDRDAQQVSLLGQLTTDAMRESTLADIAFQNAGGIRTSIAAGNITMGNLYEVFPFDNTLFTLDMTGAQVMKVLEHGIMNKKIGMVQFSGLTVNYDGAKVAGPTISATLTDGSPLDLTKTYKVVTNDFMATGGDNFTMFAEGTHQIDTYLPLRDLLATTIKKQKNINFKKDNRFIQRATTALSTFPIAS